MKIMFDDKKIIEYVVMNPSGNITILVMSDVEDEVNGILTYDRKVVKIRTKIW